jgi:HAE1 family hydrophobic/amphiphilic exporter-1
VELTLEGNEGDREVYRVEAVGRDPAILARILREVAEDLRGLPGVLEVITPADESEEEIAVVVERDRAQRFSISADQVSSMVGWMLRGAPLPDFEIDGEELPMWIRFQEQEGEGLGELTRVEMFTPDGKSVPLNSIARFETGRSLPAIRRSDRQVASRLQVVFGSEEDQRAVEARIAGALRAVELPEGYTLGTQGGSSQLREDLGELARAGAVGLLLIFIIMGVLFESLLLPLAVLCSVPFLFVGAFWSIWLFDETVTVLGGIGFVILLGVVVNNAIVLVDCVHRRRREGARRSEAILNGAEERFRPIWMTALTTISGLLPLILVPHEGGGFDYRPLAVIVLGGLAGATMLTLLAVPLFYVLFDDLGRWGRALLRGEVERWSRRGGGAESPGSPPRTS